MWSVRRRRILMPDRLGKHAVVIGGSIAGLMAARVLTDYFDQVTMLDRDHIESGDNFVVLGLVERDQLDQRPR